MRPRIVLAGILGRFPVGGVAWCALHYIAGLHDAGFDVFYVEDTGECNFDPDANAVATDPAYALGYIPSVRRWVGLEREWAYVDYLGNYHGRTREEVAAICRSSQALVNLSGGAWFTRPEYDDLRKIYIDTDPGFTQSWVADPRFRDTLAWHDVLFTFGTNVDAPSGNLPPTPFRWHPTVQPVAMRFWPAVPPPAGAPYTAILSWQVDNIGEAKGKAGDILKMIDLPRSSPERLVLAVAGRAPIELLREHDWTTVDAVSATRTPERYREFIQQSRGELGFAKAMYVETNSGWISDRTQCYLATGRPCLVRDTGCTLLPTGEGLLTFKRTEDVLAGLEAIESDYPRHARRARELAETYFATDVVLPGFLSRAGLG